MFTQVTDKQERLDFFELLVKLASDPSDLDIRIVISMRRDYYNLCSSYQSFYQQSQKCKFLVKRMDYKNLKQAIVRPLELAGVRDSDIFAKTVIDDVGDRPSDLTLMEFSLSETWNQKEKYNNNLLETYQAIGEVSGALAQKANYVYHNKLSKDEQTICQSVFVRLGKLGDTGGSTRRSAEKNEYNEKQWRLLDKLSRARYGRIITISTNNDYKKTTENDNTTVEISHEALLTQWDKLQTWLQDFSANMLHFDLIIKRNKAWRSSEKLDDYLLTNIDLEGGIKILKQFPNYLSENEIKFIESSKKRIDSIRDKDIVKDKKIRRRAWYLMALSIVLLLFAGMTVDQARKTILQAKKFESIEKLNSRIESIGDLIKQIGDLGK